MEECLQQTHLSLELKVVHIGVCRLIGARTKDSDTTSVRVLQGDQKDLLVGSLDVRETILSTSLDVKREDTNLIHIKLHLIPRILLKDVLVVVSCLTIHRKVFHLLVSVNELTCIFDRALLHRTYTSAIECLPLGGFLGRQEQCRVELYPITELPTMIITTNQDSVPRLLNTGVKLHSVSLSFRS